MGAADSAISAQSRAGVSGQQPPPAAAMGAPTAGLPICSVAFRSALLLTLQHEWIARLNPGGLIARWIVMENSPLDDPFRLSKHDARFHVQPGAKRPQGVEHPASHQHAKALNRALSLVDTRHVLIVDPDF